MWEQVNRRLFSRLNFFSSSCNPINFNSFDYEIPRHHHSRNVYEFSTYILALAWNTWNSTQHISTDRPSYPWKFRFFMINFKVMTCIKREKNVMINLSNQIYWHESESLLLFSYCRRVDAKFSLFFICASKNSAARNQHNKNSRNENRTATGKYKLKSVKNSPELFVFFSRKNSRGNANNPPFNLHQLVQKTFSYLHPKKKERAEWNTEQIFELVVIPPLLPPDITRKKIL